MPFATRSRRLRWRLTVYYALGMLATVLAMQLILLGGFWWISTRGQEVPTVVMALARQMSTEAAPLLFDSPPDAAQLDRWLLTSTPPLDRGSGIPGLPLPRLTSDPLPERLPQRYDLVAVVDERGRLVASNVPGTMRGGWETEPFRDPLAAEISDALVQGALAGEERVLRLDRGVVAAVAPILAADGARRGALYLRVVSSAPGGRLWSMAMGLVVLVGSVFAVGRLIAATAFGFLTASWIARRLDKVGQVTAAWGRGDFSVQVRDADPDELGQLARQLNRMAEQLQSVLEVREHLASLEERNRLARELHDSVKQQVFATAMQVAAARALMSQDPEAAARNLARAESLVLQAQQELNDMLRQLRPLGLAGKGLSKALRDYLNDWSERTGIIAELKVEGEGRASLAAEQVLYRVAQEALANVAHHSGSERLDVTLRYEPHAVTLEMRDFGQGFDVDAETGKGLGLISMRERVAALAGQLQVISQPGQGTTIRATLPLEVTP